jgi:CheY-like chemotaxis protein
MKADMIILLVEDDLVDVKTVKRAFKENHITNKLDVVYNGEEALEYLNGCDSSSKRLPGLILLDLNMPVMNGVEFLEVAKKDKKFKSIPVIVLTTSQEDSDRMESYNLGVAGYIIKPVEFEKFVEAVKIINLYWSLCEV